MVTRMTKDLRWASFLVYIDNKNYSQGYRDDSLQHDDYKKGIEIAKDMVNDSKLNE